MVRPLYPRPKPEPAPEPPWWKSPSILGAGVGILALAVVAVVHFGTGPGVIDPGAGPGSGAARDGGWFSFLKPSRYIRPKPIDVIAEEEWRELGLASGTVAPPALKAENYREKRRLYAFQKYETVRQLAREKENERTEFERRRSTPTAMTLKEAVSALEDSDNLGIMKLESLLKEELQKQGAKSENLDILIFAFQNLGDTYTRKNMKQKAKEAYLNAFRLLKEKAPSEEGAQWDAAMAEIEKLDATTPGN
ncbi:MAG: hypothetical protein OZSIB_0103 [Candidatus Ozemobacter sibiricus]|uniref:Uncharacterized protein n=1 Tax=Candidatus Ozemobacter sibiricus TaxID=2268124 RepID=A0A367Z8X2_9BACT|nr:MAG: hypothetical protein OZSIB_0103 [Candidatus Ozemobacter sibiricus]